MCVSLQVLLSDAGSTLSEMLQTESVLQSADAGTSTSCTLTQLLTSDSVTPGAEISNSNRSKMPQVPDSLMIAGEPFNNGISVMPPGGPGEMPLQTVSEHTLSTAGTLVQILQKGSPTLAGRQALTQLTTQLTTQSPPRQQSLLRPALRPVATRPATVVRASTTPRAMFPATRPTFPTPRAEMPSLHNPPTAASMFGQITGQRQYISPEAAAIALAEDNGLFPNLEEHTLALLNGDESNISFDNG